MKYILRNRNSEENICLESKKSLNFFYENFFGRIILKLLITKSFSNIVFSYMNSKLSIKSINKAIKKHNINMNEYEDREYKSYNDFFTREIKKECREVNTDPNIFISPCDSALSVYMINDDLTLEIKHSYYSIDTLVEKSILEEYKGGYALVFRLSEDNYHRYHYIDDGYQENNIHIKGVYHTVQPISLKEYNFYKTNNREYTILKTDNFDNVVFVEIGAMCIGRIKNEHENYRFKKGEEKGYFEFGGSTIVLLVKPDVIIIDNDILNNSSEDIETIVKSGEGIAKKILRSNF